MIAKALLLITTVISMLVNGKTILIKKIYRPLSLICVTSRTINNN